MMDGIIKADGTSRLMRAALPATYEEFKAQAAAGTFPLDILFNEAGWSQLPTFLSKANLLKDRTANLFGLGADAVPDDVFFKLSELYKHNWYRKAVGYEEVQTSTTSGTLIDETNYGTVTYSNAIEIDQQTGKISLVNPSTVYVSNNRAAESVLSGKYCYRLKGSTGENFSEVLFIPTSGVSWTYNTGSPRFVRPSPCFVVTSKQVISEEKEYLSSYDENAYPKGGISGGYEWGYFGFPFDNAKFAPKIATGSYTGTGTYGASNPNSLTFDFEPRLWGIYAIVYLSTHLVYAAAVTLLPWRERGSCSMGYPFSTTKVFANTVSYEGNTVRWFSTVGHEEQFNHSNMEYYYIAIG